MDSVLYSVAIGCANDYQEMGCIWYEMRLQSLQSFIQTLWLNILFCEWEIGKYYIIY